MQITYLIRMGIALEFQKSAMLIMISIVLGSTMVIIASIMHFGIVQVHQVVHALSLA